MGSSPNVVRLGAITELRTMETPKCSECREPMDRGFMLERDAGGAWETKWVRGAPESSFWRGTKIADKERLAIEAYRCPRCGALRLFAPPA
jgi:hypothetical protein